MTDPLAEARRRGRARPRRDRPLDDAGAAAIAQSVETRGWWLSQWPEGAEHVLGLVAQDVQEWVHDNVDSDWPLCPEHRDHALFVEPDLGPDPFWVCHKSGLPLCRVGELPAAT